MCNVVPTSHEKKTNTVCIYVFAMTQINALQCGETIANEEHVSGMEKISVGTCERV
jgi:hypothetical protein